MASATRVPADKRRIVARLEFKAGNHCRARATLKEPGRNLSLPQPNVSKQLKVLREAGLVHARIDGPRRLYNIDPKPLMALDRWLADYRSFWTAKFDALGNHLERSE